MPSITRRAFATSIPLAGGLACAQPQAANWTARLAAVSGYTIGGLHTLQLRSERDLLLYVRRSPVFFSHGIRDQVLPIDECGRLRWPPRQCAGS